MKNLVEIIKANPGCVAIVDNDCWQLYKQHPDKAPQGGDAFDEWLLDNELATDRDVEQTGEGYGAGNCYGGDLLQALAKIVGVHVESV